MKPKFHRTELEGVLLVEPHVHPDPRGFFMETYHQAKYAEGGISDLFVQDNHSYSIRDTLRGLHAQLEYPQGKLVRALQGEIFDVAVDIRPDSPNFGKWVGKILSEENRLQLWVPPGFAHGFCVLSDNAHVQYKCTTFYRQDDEITILWNDPSIGIEWKVKEPLLSDRDRNAKPLETFLPKLREHGPA